MTVLTSTAYAISAALVLYVDQQHLFPAGTRLGVIMTWAMLGVVISLVGAVRPVRTKG